MTHTNEVKLELAINDELGHEEGDRAIKDAADTLRNSLRPGDVVARLGGDEFVALLPDLRPEDSDHFIERLAQATPQSLVILDEIGRGTSTYDGLAIAWAVVEAMHDQVKCRTLFATHYHELTRLAGRLDSLSLHHVRAREWKGDLVLLHEVADGAADRSYGIAVAKLAGLPPATVARAKSVLAKLEAGRDATGGIAAGLDDLPLFASAAEPEPRPDPLSGALSEIDPDSLTPREALEHLYRLKRLAAEQGT